MASSSTATSFLLFLLLPILSHAATFNVFNNCPYTVWAAATPGGGQQLNQGQGWAVNVPAGTAGGRVWGRTGCNFDANGNGHCNTGDCAGQLQCTLSGAPPLTLAEYTLNGGNNLDYYDISVIDGFNVPMEFAPTSACKDLRCPDSSCPDAYQYPADNTKTNSCPSGTDYRVTFCP